MKNIDVIRDLEQEFQLASEDAIRIRILDATLEMLVNFGVRRTTIEDVAKRNKMGRPTIYRRFPDKNALIKAAIEWECQRSFLSIWKHLRTIEDPEEQLLQCFVAITHAAAKHPLLTRLLATEPEAVLPFLTIEAGGVIELARAQFTPYLLEMQKQGYFPDIDADYSVELLTRLFMSLLLTKTTKIDPLDFAQLDKFARTYLSRLFINSTRRAARTEK